ncbi:hypothetical protein [Alienimonas californiensis]|uniref:Uncharacterized protein n=1 Tax=Alienimonas californiensis TaxID=2527989 RepID=A0A517P981_9PLAN|nr:hypothetical protein [Alienimonas californiensis]QDT15933.1 hypothetical protein CA12_20310 [Alienimonas californiensis]
MELVVAVAVLLTVTTMLLPTARRVDVVRTEADRRRRAVAELSNLLTDLSRRPLEELMTNADGGPLPPDLAALREPFAASLPGATVSVVAVPLDAANGGPEGLEAVRLDGALAWTTAAGAAARPVRLSAWAFEAEPTDAPPTDAADGETNE